MNKQQNTEINQEAFDHYKDLNSTILTQSFGQQKIKKVDITFLDDKEQIDYSQEQIFESDDDCISILQRNLPLEMKYQTKIQSNKKQQNQFEIVDNSLNKKKTQTKCNCSKSNCLRLHCSCFKKQGYCSPFCRCQNCLNIIAYKEVRDFVLEKTKIINRAAFVEKFIEYKGIQISRRGCKCTSGCNKAYCFCFKNKVQCSSICKCVCCDNERIFVEKEDVKQIFKYLPRKKYKISINFDKQLRLSQNKYNCKVQFSNYLNPK